jgi:hypothetical protein
MVRSDPRRAGARKRRRVRGCACALALAALAVSARAQDVAGPPHAAVQALPSDVFGVNGPLSPPPPGVVDLAFRDFFLRPVGPKGLEPGPRLLDLDGSRVRLVGFMAQQEAPAPGVLILAPLPVPIAEIEDGMADDLPPGVAFVHLATLAHSTAPAYLPGLLQFTGQLSVGPQQEADGRVSYVRLLLDETASNSLQALQGASPTHRH